MVQLVHAAVETTTSGSAHLVLPRPRALLRHAAPKLVEGKLIPALLLVALLELSGVTAAVLSALAWSLGSIGYRKLTGRTVPGLVILSALGLTARTVVALVSGSLLLYFLQPTMTTALVGLGFLVSVVLGRPLAQRLVADLCPLGGDAADHPALRRFFQQLSLVWAATSLVNTAVTAWVLATQSPATFVIAKSLMGPVSTGLLFLVAVPWFRWSMGAAGVTVRLATAASR